MMNDLAISTQFQAATERTQHNAGKSSMKSMTWMNSAAKAKVFGVPSFSCPHISAGILRATEKIWQKHGGRKIRTHFKGMLATPESVVAGQSGSFVPLWLRRQPRLVNSCPFVAELDGFGSAQNFFP
jgi:hypothetical protein